MCACLIDLLSVLLVIMGGTIGDISGWLMNLLWRFPMTWLSIDDATDADICSVRMMGKSGWRDYDKILKDHITGEWK